VRDAGGFEKTPTAFAEFARICPGTRDRKRPADIRPPRLTLRPGTDGRHVKGIRRRGNVKLMALVCSTLMVACAGGPPLDNPSAPGSMRPDVDERHEARALEQAESDCATQGKHAVSQRVEGETMYSCAD
jgi:hypothetical protein